MASSRERFLTSTITYIHAHTCEHISCTHAHTDVKRFSAELQREFIRGSLFSFQSTIWLDSNWAGLWVNHLQCLLFETEREGVTKSFCTWTQSNTVTQSTHLLQVSFPSTLQCLLKEVNSQLTANLKSFASVPARCLAAAHVEGMGEKVTLPSLMGRN